MFRITRIGISLNPGKCVTSNSARFYSQLSPAMKDSLAVATWMILERQF